MKLKSKYDTKYMYFKAFTSIKHHCFFLSLVRMQWWLYVEEQGQIPRI